MSEYILYGKKRLCYTEVTDFTDFQGIGRDPLYKRYDSVYAVIEKNIDSQYRDFLAQPVYSEDDQILWYVKEWNTTPCAFNDLSEIEKARYSLIKEKTVSEYEKVMKNLSGEDRQILNGAIKYLDEDFMFCYDDKVVVVAWGMTPDSHKHSVKGAVIHDLKIQNNHKVKFIAGENGTFSDVLAGVLRRPDGYVLKYIDIPAVIPKQGYEFNGWTPDPLGVKVTKSLVFTASYEKIPVVEDTQEKREEVLVSFLAEEGGFLCGTTEYKIEKGSILDNSQVPVVKPVKGYEFAGWTPAVSARINEDTVFKAMFNHNSIECRFNAGDYGIIEGQDRFSLPYGTRFHNEDIPVLKVKKGYKFIGWDKSPADCLLDEDITFNAMYEEVVPWYKKTWMWLTGKGCFKWLLWLLLAILLILLLMWLLRTCSSDIGRNKVEPVPKIETPSGEIIDDNGAIKDIVRDDGGLSDGIVVAPIVGNDGQNPPIITNPGVPDIVGNRLNIYFENADINLEQFVSDLNLIYTEEQCKVIGIDRHVPMIQILIPENLRDMVRENLNQQLPDYEFFVVDESIFTIVGSISSDTGIAGWHLNAIDVEAGWDITKGNPDVVVAVVDDGIDANHEMLKGRIINPYNVFTQDNRLSTGQGHGTHVAGLAVGSDKLYDEGISGVAPKCKLMPIQVFDNGMCTFSSVISGIMYAIHHEADVINVSIGPNFRGLDILPLPDQDYIARTQFKNEERVWKRIINVANEHNAVIVFAAGNDNILARIPPENRTDFTINVAAVDSGINGTDFTNYGLGSNISAPGKGIISSVPVNDYAIFDGTSMAAPIVSGTVALMKSCKPDISVAEVLHILQATGKAVSDYVPPMVQVDDALIALTTGVIPDIPSDDAASPSDKEESTSGDDTSITDDEILPSDDDTSVSEDAVSSPVTDYDAIRRLIEEYKQKIRELEKLLPENK